jgi:3',5'-cyclic AMP phosphodiesterase CpdA
MTDQVRRNDGTNKAIVMIIAQITDTHLRAKSSDDIEGAARAENLRRCIADIGSRSPAPQIAIHTGDMTERGKAAEFAHAREILERLDIPLYIIPGNRDGRDGMRRAFADHDYLPRDAGFLSYAFEDYPVRLVALDSIDEESPMGQICETRLAWLNTTLARQPDKPTLLIMHHPPFDVAADHPFAFEDRASANALSSVVSKHRQVVRVLCGHVHRSAQVAWGGTIGSTTPCVAGDLRKGPGLEGGDGQPVNGCAVYEIHTLLPEGRLESTLRVLR